MISKVWMALKEYFAPCFPEDDPETANWFKCQTLGIALMLFTSGVILLNPENPGPMWRGLIIVLYTISVGTIPYGMIRLLSKTTAEERKRTAEIECVS